MTKDLCFAQFPFRTRFIEVSTVNIPTKVFFISVLFAGCSSMSPIEKESESKSHFEDAVFKGHDFY